MTKAIVVVGAVLVGGALVWLLVLEPRWAENETARLSRLLEVELVEYETPRARPPHGGPSVAGDACTAYSEALAAYREPESDRNWTAAIVAYGQSGALPAPGREPESERVNRIFAAVSRGARHETVGRLFSPREGPSAEFEYGGIQRTLEFDALLRLRRRDVRGCIERLLLSQVFARDVLPHDTQPLWRSMEVLRDVVETERLSTPIRDRLIAFLSEDLTDCVGVLDVTRFEYLSWQVGFRQILSGEVRARHGISASFAPSFAGLRGSAAGAGPSGARDRPAPNAAVIS